MTTTPSPSPMDVLGHAANDSRLSDGDCTLLLKLYQNHRGFLVKGLKQQVLATQLGVSTRTISSRIASLIQAGYIKQFILGNNLPPSYYLVCFAPNLAKGSEAVSDTKDSATSNVERAKEEEGIPLKECPPPHVLPSTTEVEDSEFTTNALQPSVPDSPIDQFHSPDSSFAADAAELIKLIGRRQLGTGIPELVYLQDDQITAKEILLCRRYLVNVNGSDPRDPSFGKQVESMLNAKHMRNPAALDELWQNCQSRFDRAEPGDRNQRMAEIELAFIDELAAKHVGDDTVG